MSIALYNTAEQAMWNFGNRFQVGQIALKYSTDLKQHKPWFDEECLGFLDQRKRAKMQWVQDSSQSNVDNLNQVRRDVSRHFRNKKKAYLRAKIEELETNSKVQKTLGTCVGASMTLRRGTSLDVI